MRGRRQRKASAEAVSAGKSLRHGPVGGERRLRRRHNAGELDRRCFIRQGDVCSLPYGDGAFDAVTAFETVYFWSPVSKALAEVFRVLRKGGCFLISLEASDPELGKAWTDRIKGMTVYGAEDLKRLLSKAGFSDIRMIQKKEELHIIAHK